MAFQSRNYVTISYTVIQNEKKVMLVVSVDPPAAGTVALSQKGQLFPSSFFHIRMSSLWSGDDSQSSAGPTRAEKGVLSEEKRR